VIHGSYQKKDEQKAPAEAAELVHGRIGVGAADDLGFCRPNN
jgi:hypothetical protein